LGGGPFFFESVAQSDKVSEKRRPRSRLQEAPCGKYGDNLSRTSAPRDFFVFFVVLFGHVCDRTIECYVWYKKASRWRYRWLKRFTPRGQRLIGAI
jgi:hypothetical protein